jgi:alpha-galactosidase
MPISWDARSQQLHLRSESVSYVMQVLDNGWLGHLYFGRPLAEAGSYSYLAPESFTGFSNRLGDPIALEFPTGGSGDFRVPALVVEQADGSTVLDLRYKGHRLIPGKPALDGLPSTYVEVGGEAETLEITLADSVTDLEVQLRYSVYRNRPVVIRGVRLVNRGKAPLIVRGVMSASLDLSDPDWTLITLNGDWARERQIDRRPLRPGRQSVASTRGVSSPQHNPFIALARPGTTEDRGEVIGLSLAYSGNFLAEVDVESYGTCRARIGINPEGFSWLLDAGASFDTPEAILVHSDGGLDEMSQAYHDLFRTRMARGTWRDKPRPILINNWEATYFDFDEPKLLEIASSARELGIELFVLDDGWFGRRDDDTTSLGDWQVDRRKLPGGLESLAGKIEAMGMRFGLWIEPEMISRASKLYEAHPEWEVGIPSRPRTEMRNQYVLDMSRPEVVDYLFGVLSGVLGSAPISYVKWDMNRYLTEPFTPTLPAWRQGEFFHRYVLGVYALYDRLTKAFPGILFESCSSGGARFDPGILAFAPQGWTSDNTDAIDRLRIQYGTSLVYPLSSMGAHVSAAPNHQIGRVVPLTTRALVAFFGDFGYELDPSRLTQEERAAVAEQVTFYKRWREVIQFGRFHRLLSPFENDANEAAWIAVSPDRKRALAAWYQILNRANVGPRRLRLRGLDPAASYRVSVWPDESPVEAPHDPIGGDALMWAGLPLESKRVSPEIGDFHSRMYVLEAEGAGQG